MRRIDYFFDFLSPYSYLSWTWLRANVATLREQNIELHFIPVSLPKVVKRFETLGPAEIAPKRNYLFKDCLRFAALNGIPFQTPAKLPFNSQEALRLSLKEVCADQQELVIDAIFRAGWERGENIEESQILKNCLANAGLDADKLIEGAALREARAALKSNFKLASSLDLFGLPSFWVTVGESKELFWGNDSIPHMNLFLNGDDPLDDKKVNNFINHYPISH